MVNENNEKKKKKKKTLRHMKTKKAEDYGEMAARDEESVRGRQAGLLVQPLEHYLCQRAGGAHNSPAVLTLRSVTPTNEPVNPFMCDTR